MWSRHFQGHVARRFGAWRITQLSPATFTPAAVRDISEGRLHLSATKYPNPEICQPWLTGQPRTLSYGLAKSTWATVNRLLSVRFSNNTHDMAPYQCPSCQVKCFTYFKLLNHLRLYHEMEAGFKVTCGLEGCPRQYSTITSLKKHIRVKHHSQSFDEVSDGPGDSFYLHSDDVESDDETPIDSENSFSHKLEKLKSNVRRHFALFSLKLQEKHVVPRVVQTDVADDVKVLLEYFREEYSQLINTCCQETGVDVDNNLRLKSLLDGSDLDNCFSDMGNVYQFEKYCLHQFGLIEPVEYTLGHDDQGRRETFQYIPLLDVLKFVLSKGDIWNYIENKHNTRDGVLVDFCDGTIYQNHKFFSSPETRLRVHLYNDEFEVVNPLGSKKLLHKVSGFYFLIGNLPPKYRSQLKHIHLCLLVRYKLVQKYGFEPILKPLLSDLLKLQSEGVDIILRNGQINVKGSVAVISSDNLTAHSLAGFSGSFSNGRICRFCMCHYNDMSDKLEEHTCVIRTAASHRYHLQCVEHDDKCQSLYGVTRQCPFSILPNFEVTEAFPPDVMHDFLEGVVPLVLKLIIKKFHSEGIVTVQQLNKELREFPFGQNDRTSKPVVISVRVLHEGTIAGKASEKWTLLRVLPFLIGKFIQENNRCWSIFLLLREIGDVILAPVIETCWLSHLESLITSFLFEFREQFPGNFTPKMHFLVHYPRLIEEYGPLRSVWCMRYEAKHLYFKKLASVINNFKNVCYSLSKRYQMRQCWEWQANNDIGADIIPLSTTGVSFRILPDRLQDLLSENLNIDGECARSEILWKTKEIVSDTVKYRVGDFFILDVVHAEQIPQFVKILHILKFRSHWWLCGRLYETVQFCDHLHAYSVRDSHQWMAFRPGDEVDFQALDCYKDDDDDLYITIRHRTVPSSQF